ncbi:MAG: hypothetical protein ACRDSP_17860 [Pseudonocardiaceae bacterium]
MGELLGQPVDPEYVGRLERGVLTWPHGYHREALRAYFGVASDEELGFYCRRSAPAPAWEDEMRRRALLAALPLAGLATSGTLGALVEAAAAEAVPIPRRVGADQVAQVRALSTHAYQMGEQFGGGAVRETLSAQVRWAVGLLDAHVDPVASRGLHSAVGHMARLAGSSSHDVGADGAAHRYHQVALYCAEQSQDWWLRAATLKKLARIAEYSGDGETALTLAQQAMVRPDRLTLLQRADLTTVEARAHGKRGDDAACLAAAGRAEDHVAAADPASEYPAMVAFFSPAELAGETGCARWPLAMRGQGVTETARLLHTAADTYPSGAARSRNSCLARLATLQFTHGDPHEAVTTARTYLDAARTVQSRRITGELTSLRHATTKHHTLTAVADLRHRLNHTLASV